MQIRQTFTQSQQLKMNPQLYQSIKLMELPIADLREKIEEELERNPALEIIKDRSTVRLNEIDEKSYSKYDYFEASSDSGRRTGETAADEHRRFLEGALSRPETLQEHLLQQLQLEPVDEELRAIAETLIQNLDDDGFHKEKPEMLFPVLPPRLQEAIELVRDLEPVGCCTIDYRESLLYQIEQEPDAPVPLTSHASTQLLEDLLNNLELIEREKYSALAKKIGLNENDTNEICRFLKKLSPFPGRVFAPKDVRYVIPDIKVVKDNSLTSEELVIILNDEAFPVLGVNKFLEDLNDSDDKAARDFARENIREARLFIDHLKRRNQTLIRVANAILQFQRSFFLYGPKHLAPLTLTDIARELDVHETTISRIANGKYMQTEWGIYEIRRFFTNSISGAGSSGSKFSKESVKEIIKEIIEAESRNSGHGIDKLSDQKISELLSQKGIELARRTVAKYRKELDMGSSYKR